MARRAPEPEPDEPPPGDGLRSVLSAVANEARRMLVEPADRLSAAAHDEAQRLARAWHDEVERVQARASRAAVLTGGCVAAAVLIVVGLAGGLGEWFDRPWLGQLVAGVVVLGLAAAIGAWVGRKADDPHPADDPAADADADDAAPGTEAPRSGTETSAIANLLLAGSVGWLASRLLAARRGHRRR